MKKIFKYPVPVRERFTMELPKGAKIIRVEDMDGFNALWAIVDPEEKEKETRSFAAFKTGAPMPDDILESYVYLGLCKLFIMQELGLYIFERVGTKEVFHGS